MIILSFI